MKLAVLSDVHGNLEALQAVLADMDRLGVDQGVSLGDAVGYGPDPEACLDLLRERGIPGLLGNHELGLKDPAYLDQFNPQARQSLLITGGLLSERSYAYLRSLPHFLIRGEARFVHGCPPDSVTTYLFELSDQQLRELWDQIPERLCFVGHTHTLELLRPRPRGLRRAALGQGLHSLKPPERVLINSGSVGQPRDSDRRAKYLVWDQERYELEVRCLDYEVAATVAKIRQRGLPEINARRLL